MRFVLVNGRTPCPQTFCLLCCEPIGAGYLREIETGLPFCDDNCYRAYSRNPVLALLDDRTKLLRAALTLA